MRILRAVHSLDPASGGPAEVIRQFGAPMRTTEVVSLDPPGARYLRDFPIRVHAFGPGKGKFGFNPKLQRWLQQHASEFDAVVIDGIWQFHSVAVWRALRHSKTPYVVFPHGMLDPWFKRQFPLKHLKKLPYWLLVERRVLRDAAAVVYTCEEERILARQSFPLYRAKEQIVPLGTTPPSNNPAALRSAFIARYPAASGKRIALFLGRIHPKKGCDLLIEAFSNALRHDPDWHLVMAGPDQVGWQAELQTSAARMGIADRITWTGMLGSTEKWAAYAAAEIFVLPSHQENFGVAVAEALACGLPALISNKVNIWREVEAAGAGLVGEDNLPGTTELLHRWEVLNEDAKQAMGQAAADCFRAKFDIAVATGKLTQLLASIGPSLRQEAIHA